jgi:hypothetical protein
MGSGNGFRGLKGWLAACAAATAALYVILFLVVAVAPSLAIGTPYRPMTIESLGVLVSLILFPLIMIAVCLVSAIPAAFAIFVADAFRIRSVLFFGCAGAVTGVVGQIVVFQSLNDSAWVCAVAGLVAGLIYWRVAVRPLAGEEA